MFCKEAVQHRRSSIPASTGYARDLGFLMSREVCCAILARRDPPEVAAISEAIKILNDDDASALGTAPRQRGQMQDLEERNLACTASCA